NAISVNVAHQRDEVTMDVIGGHRHMGIPRLLHCIGYAVRHLYVIGKILRPNRLHQQYPNQQQEQNMYSNPHPTSYYFHTLILSSN
ncbi:MAG: hypothetical protein IKZ54_08790, partial [Bacteroidales bacterium]|nr:hypothetical protein [Bacteroidales bacterium]